MNLSKKECIPVALQILDNSNEVLNDGKSLSENHSYGRATSLLILSMEESIKALVLFLDGQGFEFRKRVKGIKNLFTNHKLRYPVALIVSAFNIFQYDLQQFINGLRENPQITPDSINENQEEWAKRIQKYFIEKVEQIAIEITWFTNAEFLRQKGMYVDFDDELQTPLNIKEEDYTEVLDRVLAINEFVNNFIKELDWEHKGKYPLKEQFMRLHNELIEKNGYQTISNLTSKFDSKVNPMINLIDKLDEVKTDMLKEPFNFGDQNIMLNRINNKRGKKKQRGGDLE